MPTMPKTDLFFCRVKPMRGYKLFVSTAPGDEIVIDFAPRLATTRFADLRDARLFRSAATDGASIIFSLPGVMPVRISAGELFALMTRTKQNSVSEREQSAV